MRNIMAKVIAEREKGARIVMLLKSATSEVWWPEQADHVAFVRGRISFDLPRWFVPATDKDKASSAGFAVAICVFDKEWRGQPMQYIERDTLLAQGNAIISMIEQRASELASQPTVNQQSTNPCQLPEPELSTDALQLPDHIADASEMVGTVIDVGTKAFISETEETETQPVLTAESEQQAYPDLPVADEELLPAIFTIDSMCDHIRAGKLPFDGVPMALTLKLYEMFGEIEQYTLRQVRTAIIAIEEPDMVTKTVPTAEPEQTHNWPVEVFTALGNALTKNPMKLTKPQRETVCSAINEKILTGCSKDEATNVAAALLKEYQSCAA